MSTPVYEIQRESNSVVIWMAGVGHRVVFESEVSAMLQEDILTADERKFHEAKEARGVYVISKFGDDCTPFDYIQRLFKSYRSKLGQHMGIVVYENTLSRGAKEYW